MQNFGDETSWQETTYKTEKEVTGWHKNDLTEVGCEDCS